jgi:hypothetical protein
MNLYFAFYLCEIPKGMLELKIEDTLALLHQFSRFITAIENEWTIVRLQWERLENCWQDSQHQSFEKYFEYLIEQHENVLNECNKYSLFLQCKISEVSNVSIFNTSSGQQKEVNFLRNSANLPLQNLFDITQQENSLSLQKVDPSLPLPNIFEEKDNPSNSLYLIGILYDELVEISAPINLSPISSSVSSGSDITLKDCLSKFSEVLDTSIFGKNIDSLKKQYKDCITSLLLSSNIMTGLVANQIFQFLNSPMRQAELVLSIPSKFYEYIEFGEKTTSRTSKVLNIVNQSNIKSGSLENINNASQNLNKFLNEALDNIQNNHKLLKYDQDSVLQWKDEEEKKRKRFQKQLEIDQEVRTEKLKASDMVL